MVSEHPTSPPFELEALNAEYHHLSHPFSEATTISIDKLDLLQRCERVRYVKLGSGGGWEHECLHDSQTVRLGFWGDQAILDAATQDGPSREARRAAVADLVKDRTKTPTDAARQILDFVDDDGRTLWITFHNRRMYWGFLDTDEPVRPFTGSDGEKGFIRPVAGGWSCHAITEDGSAGEPLLLDDLAGHLGMVTQYRGTICQPKDEGYVMRRVRGQVSEVAADAAKAIAEAHHAIERMLGELTPGDFEILVDMVFSASGWRRVGRVGGTEKLIDLVLVRPAQGRRAADGGVVRIAVQVKLETTQREFEAYRSAMLDAYDHGYFVYVRAKGGGTITSDDDRFTLFDSGHLAPMVLDAGLMNWLLRRVR